MPFAILHRLPTLLLSPSRLLQVEKIADKNNYMDVCSALRKQQDEEVNLSMQMQVREKEGMERAQRRGGGMEVHPWIG